MFDNVTRPSFVIVPAPRELMNNGRPPSTIALAICPLGVFNKRIVPVTVPFSSISIDSILCDTFSRLIFIELGCSNSPGQPSVAITCCNDSTIAL